MTLKELLDRCDFKDIAPHIKRIDDVLNLVKFKEAFDTLRHLTPKKREWDNTLDEETNRKYEIIEIEPEYYENEDVAVPRVTRMDMAAWEEELACEIIVSDKLSLSDEEIAAVCLYELTYWGNMDTEKGRRKYIGQIEESILNPNPYMVAWGRLYGKMSSNYGRIRESWWIFFDRLPRNRAKRMRDHRQKKRMAVLDRLIKVEDEIRDLTFNSQSFSREELAYLFDTKRIGSNEFCSRSYNINKRIDYLVDLFENYIPKESFVTDTDFVLMFRTSSENPLSEKELDAIHVFFKNYFPATATVRFGYGVDEELGEEVGLHFVGSH